MTDFPNYLEESMKHPQLYYGSLFFINIIVTACCILTARWLRNTKSKPPLFLYIIFNLLFISFTLIVLSWWEDFALVISSSSLFSFFMSSFIIVILIFLFYLYTRLTANNLSGGKNTDYTPFIPLLSRRELEVIEAILAGNTSYKELSNTLNISVNTVKTHLKHIYQTTGVSNIAALSSLFHGFSGNHP